MSQEDTDPPLPPELWRAITNPYISINDSCNLALVSRSMWGRAREHTQWSNLKVNWSKLRKRGAHSLFDCPSFNRVKVLSLREGWSSSSSSSDSDDDNELLNDVLECSLNSSTLEEIEFDLNISEVSPDLLASAVSRLKGVTFTYQAKLTNPQLIRILEESSNLVKLVIPRRKLFKKSKPVRLLGNITAQLNTLDISNSEFTTNHMKQILTCCLQSDTLTDLDLSGIDLSGISAGLLAKVCASLQNVNLRGTKLTTEQITSILNASSISRTLKGLDFTYSDMSMVSVQLLTAAVLKLETVKMKKTYLTDVKHVNILIHSLSSSTLKKLSLSSDCRLIILNLVNTNPRRYQLDLSEKGPFLPPSFITTILTKAVDTSSLSKLDLTGINLSSISATLIASLASQLHTIILSNTKLTTKTITTILKELLRSTKIKKINLTDNTLTHVSADLLVNVTEKLDEFTAEASGLTTEQSTRILQTSAVCFLSFNNLSAVNPEAIYKNYRKNILLEDRERIRNTCLTTAQIEIIFQSHCESDVELPKFTMSYQNLSNVSIDVLSKFVSKCTNVSLNNCELTQQQVISILQKSLQSTTLKSLCLRGNEFQRNMPENLIDKLIQLEG